MKSGRYWWVAILMATIGIQRLMSESSASTARPAASTAQHAPRPQASVRPFELHPSAPLAPSTDGGEQIILHRRPHHLLGRYFAQEKVGARCVARME